MRRIEPLALSRTRRPDGLSQVGGALDDSRRSLPCGRQLQARPSQVEHRVVRVERAVGVAERDDVIDASASTPQHVGDAARARACVSDAVEHRERRRGERRRRATARSCCSPSESTSSQSRSTSSPPTRATTASRPSAPQHGEDRGRRRRRLRARPQEHLAQRARRQVGPLGQEHDPVGRGPHDAAFAGAPRRRPSRGTARPARPRRRSTSTRVPARHGRRQVVDQRRAPSPASAASGPRRRGAPRRRPTWAIRRARAALVAAPRDRLLSRASTAAYEEIDWNWVTISENAPSRCENAIADCVITPNSTSPRMKSGPTISAGMIWIR